MTPVQTVLVIAKQPVPGRVKTRLIGPCSAEQAAELAEQAIHDTLAALADFPCQDKVILLDGELAPPPGWRVVPQSGNGLDERLVAGFEAVVSGPAVLVGMDTPQLSSEVLAFDHRGYDACLGLAADGGFWAIGFTDPAQARPCILGVPMSTPETGAEQRRRLDEAGLRVQPLPVLIDVDTAASAEAVARTAPHTRFARTWRAMRPAEASA